MSTNFEGKNGALADERQAMLKRYDELSGVQVIPSAFEAVAPGELDFSCFGATSKIPRIYQRLFEWLQYPYRQDKFPSHAERRVAQDALREILWEADPERDKTGVNPFGKLFQDDKLRGNPAGMVLNYFVMLKMDDFLEHDKTGLLQAIESVLAQDPSVDKIGEQLRNASQPGQELPFEQRRDLMQSLEEKVTNILRLLANVAKKKTP